TQIDLPQTPCKPLKNNVSLGVSKTRENRVMSTISQHNPAGKTSTYLATGQHPGVSQPHYPFTAHPPSQPIRENLPAES
ncbi:hypothetical protein, partial [Bifidobacterium pseudocatenulatum]|uniref:hypothetical protein n=1 Tax=Bifidobacterium pseudocatenulatum TaxID=28026 RepID=UPI001CFD174C